MPDTLPVLITRFVATIMMHLSVEGDVRQGLKIMKYVSNHPHFFNFPSVAFVTGLMQIIGGILTEVLCIVFLTSLNSEIEVIIRFSAFKSIASIDNFYTNCLPTGPGNPLLNDVAPYKVENTSRTRKSAKKGTYSCWM